MIHDNSYLQFLNITYLDVEILLSSIDQWCEFVGGTNYMYTSGYNFCILMLVVQK